MLYKVLHTPPSHSDTPQTPEAVLHLFEDMPALFLRTETDRFLLRSPTPSEVLRFRSQMEQKMTFRLPFCIRRPVQWL